MRINVSNQSHFCLVLVAGLLGCSHTASGWAPPRAVTSNELRSAITLNAPASAAIDRPDAGSRITVRVGPKSWVERGIRLTNEPVVCGIASTHTFDKVADTLPAEIKAAAKSLKRESADCVLELLVADTNDVRAGKVFAVIATAESAGVKKFSFCLAILDPKKASASPIPGGTPIFSTQTGVAPLGNDPNQLPPISLELSPSEEDKQPKMKMFGRELEGDPPLMSAWNNLTSIWPGSLQIVPNAELRCAPDVRASYLVTAVSLFGIKRREEDRLPAGGGGFNYYPVNLKLIVGEKAAAP